LFLQLLSRGSADVRALLVAVTRSWEAATTIEAARIVAMLATETSAREASAVRDSAALRVEDAEFRAALAEREAVERLSRVDAENAMALASAREDAECVI
jgi:hypothetical protein